MNRAIILMLVLCGPLAAQTRLDFRRMAPVEVVKPTGRVVAYGVGAATDAARGAALLSAAAAATAHDTIRLASGTFATTNQSLALADNVHVVGSGRDASFISLGSGAFLAGDNANVSQVKIGSTATGGPLRDVAGAVNMTGVVFTQVYLAGGLDCILYNNAATVVEATFIDTKFTSSTDAIIADGVSSAVLKFIACDVTTTAASPGNVIQVGTGATATFMDCLINITGSISVNGLFVKGTAHVFGGSMQQTVSFGANNWINVQPGGTLHVGGFRFDTTKVANSGTINYTNAGLTRAELASIDSGSYTKRVVTIPVSDFTSDLTTGDGKNYWRVPATLNGWDVVGVAGHVTTASSSGVPTFQIHNVTDGVDVLSTRITIDASEKDSATAASGAVINTANDNVTTADELRIDVDGAGTGTKGASVEITFQKP